MLTRRDLLHHTPLLALAPSVPLFLAETARAARMGNGGHILVVLQLDGGNDGLNTVVPFADEHYARLRPTLKVEKDKVLKLSDAIGLHPSLKGLAERFEQSGLAVVQGVGYPNPNRSHDVSMAIWHTARFERDDLRGHGWLGRALDAAPPPPKGVPSAVVAGAVPLPGALFSRRAVSATVDTLDEYAHADLAAPRAGMHEAVNDNEAFVRRTSLEARETVERLRDLAQVKGPAARYPTSELARRLELVAQMIKAGLETPVYYAVQPGYDTHFLQAPPHAVLLSELDGAVQAFFADLEASQLAERVLLMTFSEFGRRAEENASLGTDHGAAAPMFLVGPGVQSGLHGRTASLGELVDGDLATALDFRAVYATVLERWLGFEAEATLAGAFEPLPILRA